MARRCARSARLVDLPALVLLMFGIGALRPRCSPRPFELQRPIFEQDSFVALTVAHVALVALSSAASIVAGVGAGIFITRPSGREFRPLVENTVAIGQTIPRWRFWPSSFPSSGSVKCRR